MGLLKREVDDFSYLEKLVGIRRIWWDCFELSKQIDRLERRSEEQGKIIDLLISNMDNGPKSVFCNDCVHLKLHSGHVLYQPCMLPKCYALKDAMRGVGKDIDFLRGQPVKDPNCPGWKKYNPKMGSLKEVD